MSFINSIVYIVVGIILAVLFRSMIDREMYGMCCRYMQQRYSVFSTMMREKLSNSVTPSPAEHDI